MIEKLESLFDHLEWLSTRPRVKERAKRELSNFGKDFYKLDLNSPGKVRELVERYDAIVDGLYGQL